MSVGHDFDRSILERKDRAALLAIAESLGAKASSRAKKADIVDAILAAAGQPAGRDAEPASAAAQGADAAVVEQPIPPVDDDVESAPAAPSGGGVERPAPDTAGSDTASRDSGSRDASARRVASNGGGGNVATGGRRDANGSSAVDRAASGNDRAASGNDRAASGNDRDNRAASGSDRNDRNDQDRDNPNRADHPNANQGNPNHNEHPNANPGNPNQNDQGDTEPGNRRRRRRGRDRRNDEDSFQGDPIEVEGLLDLRDEGYGFLRLHGYLPSKDDVYVSVKQVRQFGLRRGDRLKGKSRPASRQEKNPALLQIDAVDGQAPDKAQHRVRFEDLTPLFPDSRLSLELKDDPSNMTARIIDLVAPIGKGQRGMIVSPPKAGKTTVMKQVARSIEINHPDVALFVLLVDERPEEVTDMKRWLINGEVAASTFDRPSEEHTQVAELVLERTKRLVEAGRDVVIILDGITRLARAYNLAAPATGRIMSGGIDTGALYPPKKFFGAARNVEEGGSLTILATALVETGSKMDEVIFEEFKGTGNMELKLDRRMADRRIYPAIDVESSSTRHEELLFEHRHLQQVWRLRRVLGGLKEDGASDAAGLEMLIDRMKAFKTNDEFLKEIAKAQVPG